jgi:hypothetical protein
MKLRCTYNTALDPNKRIPGFYLQMVVGQGGPAAIVLGSDGSLHCMEPSRVRIIHEEESNVRIEVPKFVQETKGKGKK